MTLEPGTPDALDQWIEAEREREHYARMEFELEYGEWLEETYDPDLPYGPQMEES